jgi:hypothetical protein
MARRIQGRCLLFGGKEKNLPVRTQDNYRTGLMMMAKSLGEIEEADREIKKKENNGS